MLVIVFLYFFIFKVHQIPILCFVGFFRLYLANTLSRKNRSTTVFKSLNRLLPTSFLQEIFGVFSNEESSMFSKSEKHRMQQSM